MRPPVPFSGQMSTLAKQMNEIKSWRSVENNSCHYRKYSFVRPKDMESSTKAFWLLGGCTGRASQASSWSARAAVLKRNAATVPSALHCAETSHTGRAMCTMLIPRSSSSQKFRAVLLKFRIPFQDLQNWHAFSTAIKIKLSSCSLYFAKFRANLSIPNLCEFRRNTSIWILMSPKCASGGERRR
jgi:hypothetical protein